MPRWIQCLCKWAVLTIRRQRERAGFTSCARGRDEAGAGSSPGDGLARRLAHCSRAPVESLEPRLLFSAAPAAEHDALFVPADRAVALDALLLNDTDADADPLSVVIDTPPTHGGVVPDGQGGLVYQPDAGYLGPDSFTYRASDGSQQSSVVAVAVTVGESATSAVDAGVDRWIELVGDALSEVGGAYLPSPTLASDAPGAVVSWAVDWGDGHAEPLAFDPVTGQPIVGPHTYWTPGTKTVRFTAIDGDARYDASIDVVVQDSVALVANDHYTTPADQPVSAPYAAAGVLGNDALDPAQAWSLTVRHPSDPNQDATLAAGSTGSASVDTGRGVFGFGVDGAFVYLPHAGQTGTDAIVYEVDNGQGTTDRGLIEIDVRDTDTQDRSPDAASWAVTVAKGAVFAIDDPRLGVLGRSSDPDGDRVRLATTQPSAPAQGSLTLNDDGTLVYDPQDPQFTGEVTIDYALDDGPGGQVWGQVTLTYIDHAPVATDTRMSATAGLSVEVPDAAGLLALGSDRDGDTLTLATIDGVAVSFIDAATPSSYFTAQGGLIELYEDGGFHYTPATGFVGEDAFTYTLTDGGHASEPATVRIDVGPGTLSLADDLYNARAKGILSVPAESGLLANDLDSHGRALMIENANTIYPTEQGGQVIYGPDGSFYYQPDAAFTGEDRFGYTVVDAAGHTHTAQVALVVDRRPPLAFDDAYTAGIGQSIAIDLLANDLPGPDGMAIHLHTLESLDAPQFGTLVAVDADAGLYTYTAPTGWSGTFALAYTVTDGVEISEPAELLITVLDEAVVAIDDSYELSHGQPLVVDGPGVLSNDVGPAGVLQVAQPGVIATRNGGQLDINADGSFTYTPEAGFVGTDTVAYRLAEVAGVSSVGEIVFEVTNAAPTAGDLALALDEDAGPTSVALPIADTDPADGGALTIDILAAPSNGQLDQANWTYTPDPHFAGQDRFTYAVTDTLGETAYGTVRLDVASLNDAPTADPVTLSLNPDDTLRVDLRQYIDDADGDVVSFVQTAGPGSVTADGVFSFDPAGTAGTSTAVFTVSDGGALPATFALTLDVANAAPVGYADAYVTHDGLELRVTGASGVLANDTDDYKQSVTAIGSSTVLTTATLGVTVTLDPNGGFVYQTPTLPAGTTQLTDTFTYTPADGHASGGATTVTILVTADDVIASDDRYAVKQGQIVEVLEPLQGLLRNDIDALDPTSNTALSVHAELKNTDQGGFVQLFADGTFYYASPDEHVGLDTFTYTVTNTNTGATASAAVRIDVRNTAPVAVGDRYELIAVEAGATPSAYSRAADQGLLLNDYDADGDAIHVQHLTIAGTTYPHSTPITVLDDAGEVAGTLVVFSDGAFDFTPAAGYVGDATVAYKLTDRAQSSTGQAVFDIVNRTPTPAADAYRLHVTDAAGDGAAMPSVLDNDYDADAHPFIAALPPVAPGQEPRLAGDSFTTDRGATVVFNSDGTFTYSADPGFVGVDSFTYAPTDGLEAIPQSAWTTVTIDVWNQLPLPAGDTIYAEVSYAGDPPQITGQLLTNDVLVNDHSGTNYQPGDPTSPNRALLIDPATGQPIDPAAGPGTLTLDQGTLELEPDGTFTFAPSPNYRTDGSGEYTAGGFVGTVSFRYLLEDEAERTEPVNVDLVLTNHAPQAADDVFVLTHALTIDGNVFAGHASADGDWDAEADDLTVELVYGPGDAASSFALNDDGTFSFVAAEGFDGVAQFSYRVLDGVSRYKRTSDPHTVGTVTIHAVNNTAQAGGDFVITSLDQPVDGDVLANDYYATGQGIVAESELVPGSAYGGTVELDTDGTYTFTPDAGYVGDAGFSYRLVVYADDGNGGQAVLSQSGETRVNVSVQPPVYRPVDKIFELTAGDLDGHVLTGVGSNVGQDFIEPGYTLGDVVVSAGTIGQAAGDRVVMNADGSFVFVPADPNGATRFAFDYTAGVGAGMAGQGTGSVVIYYDGTSALFDNDHTRQWADHALEGTTIEIDAAALVAMYFDTPAVVDPTTIDVEQQPWWGTFEKGTNSAGEPVWYYTADTRGLASSSTDAVVFTVKDLVGTSSRRLTLLINVQPKPQPKDDWAATPHDTAVTIDVLANDGADADGFGLDRPITANSVDAVQVVNPPTSGTAVVINKQIRYTPFANTVGPVTFEYRVIDKLGNPHDATVTVQVGPEPIQPPTAGSATADQVEFGGTMWDTHLVPITASARSPILHASIVAQGQYGYAVVNQFSDTSVELIYTLTDRPGVGVTQDTITYLIQDAHGESAQGTLTIPIDRGDDPATPADRPAYVDPNHDTSQNPASPLTLTDATDTWYASDHSIKVQVTGTATFVFSANGVTITGASQGASITATYVGDHADSAPEFTVDWQNSNATHNLTIQSSTSIAGIDFEGDLIAEVGGNIEQAITAKTIDLSAYASGKHYDIDINATLTADGGDLYIRSAANIFGDLHATGDITSHKYGNPSDIRGDLTSDIIDAGGDVLLTLVSDSTFERREISVGTEINAGGGVDLTANGGIDATINYTTALILNALDGALTGTYTNTGTQVSETDINARSIAATIDAGDSPAGSIESARDITGSITAERFGTIHSYAGSIHSTITVGDLDYLHAGVDLAGEVTGTGTLGYAHIERDLAAGGKLTFEQIDDLEIGRDWFGEVHLGDGGYANNDPLHIGSRFIGKLTNTSDEQPSITAGRYLFGEITAENATNSFYLHADESLAMWVTAPLAHIASVTAGIQNDIDRPGTIEAARIKANSIGTIAAYAETGAQGPDAGLIGGSTFELTTGPLGGGGPALNTVYADGRVSGLTIHIPNVAAADTAIGSVRAAQSLARIASMSITTPGSIGSIQSGGPGSAGGDLELTKLSAGHVGTLSATNGSVSGEIDLAHGIDEIKAGIELSANITTRAGDLGLIDPNRIPTIVVGAVVSGDLTAANGSIGAIVSGVRSAGGISGDITANHGEVRGLTVINVDNPFETSNQDMAWQSPGRGQDVTVPDSSVVQAVMDAAIPPREARRVGFAQAGAISGTIKARTLGPVNTMGAITGKIIATGQLPSVRAFGAIGDDAVIVSGLGELQLESWGIVGGAIHAQTDLTIHAFGTFKATAAGGQDTYVTTWSDVGQGADIRGLLHAGVWSRQSITDLVIDAALGTTSVNTWSDASGITMRSGKTGRIVTAGEINQARYNGTSDESNLVSLSFGDQVWLETSSLRDQYVVSGGNLTHPGGEQSGDTFLAITGGYLDFESELKLESGELTMLVHGEFRGKASVGFDDSKVADDDQPSSIKLDAGSVSSSAQLSARHITIASNGDASGTITARDALMLDVQGDLAGTHQSTKGGVQVLAGKTANATITGQLGVVVQAQEQVKGTVQSPGGHLQVTALNATNAQNAIDGQFTGYASASLIGWGDVKATAASGSRLTEGGLDVFAKGNVSADAVLRAGGQVGVEAWGEVKGTIHAGQGDAGSEHDAVVIAHAGIDATIDATGWVQAVSLQDLAGTITSANGGVALQAGGELGATVTAKSDIDALARSIAAADFTSTHANLSAIALTAADFGEVIAKGNIELVADQSVTADLVHALGETDPAGIPTLRPQVNLVANAGTLDIDQLFAPHGDVSAYAALGVTLTTAPPSPPEPDPNADPPEPDPPPPPPLPRSVSALANADVAGKLHAQQQATAIALGGDAGTSAGSITLTEAIVTADGGSLQLFARGAIGGETFTATSAG
ncbi:MAG: Ig-like domain-containing protein [Phycisphaeraceae bacterium]